MPTYTTTSLHALRWLQGGNLVSDIDAGFQALAEDVDARLGAHGYAEVLTSQSTSSAGPLDLATAGPSVTVTVPVNALVEVYAQVTLSAVSAATAEVYLDEDGVNLGRILANTTPALTMYTLPQVSSAAGTAVRIYGGWLTFPASAGSHTYKLRYSSPGLVASTFVDRKLRVRTIPA